MSPAQIAAAAVFAAVCQAVALCIATRLMVNVPISYALAARIVVVEYAAAACIAGVLLVLAPGGHALPLAAGALTYLFVGAACIDRWMEFGNGNRLGVGNGVLIQAIQVPLIIPVLIAGSFLFDAQTGLGASG